MLSIYVDFKSAASYLALAPTLAMIEETGIMARWFPFSSRPFQIPAINPDETVGERHRRVRAIAQRDTHLHYARTRNLEMHFAEKPAGSAYALAALAAIESDPLPFIHAAFQSYWVDGADLEDSGTVNKLLKKTGYSAIDYAAGQERLDNLRKQALDNGIFETPTYDVDGQKFLGREHLPWIRNLIDGRTG